MNKFVKAMAVLSLVAAVMLGGSAWALDADDHVSVAPNGLGDVLIFPAYFTGSGWNTKLTVINHSQELSTVAKVVFRSEGASTEVRDFMIFLSPNDVWTGVVFLGNDNLPYIRSTDDSCIAALPAVNNPTFASEATPFEIFFEKACPYETNQLGYVEVFQAATWNITPDLNGTVPKRVIYAAWCEWVGNGCVSEWEPIGRGLPKNILAGVEEIRNDINQYSWGVNATALKNYDNAAQLNIGVQTFLGEGSNNTIGEVEAALSKNDFVIPYYAGDRGSFLATFLFPTKLAIPTSPACTANQAVRGVYSAFPTPAYAAVAYDLSENRFVVSDPGDFVSPQPPPVTRISTFPKELNFLTQLEDAAAAGFEEGWARIVINNPALSTVRNVPQDTFYSDAPVIATYMRFEFDRDGQATWQYCPHELGIVTIDGAADQAAQYHFWNQADN